MTDTTVYIKETINRYLEELAAQRIVPGGGSAAALVASAGAALNSMVISYSMKENAERAEDKEFIVLKAEQDKSLNRLSACIDEDCRVFMGLMKALSSDKNAQEEYKKAAQVPMEICRECRASMGITAVLLENSNKNLATDVGCAAYMLKAAFSSAVLNVFVNLRHIEDEKFVQAVRDELAKMVEEMEGMAGEITQNVSSSVIARRPKADEAI